MQTNKFTGTKIFADKKYSLIRGLCPKLPITITLALVCFLQAFHNVRFISYLVKGSIVKWKIKCVSIGQKVGIGICLKSKVKMQGFHVENNAFSHGCYMIFNDKGVYAYEDKIKNNQTQYGLKFSAQDVIAVELDKVKNIIKFKN